MENQALNDAILSQTPGAQPEGENTPNLSNTTAETNQNSEEPNPPGNNQGRTIATAKKSRLSMVAEKATSKEKNANHLETTNEDDGDREDDPEEILSLLRAKSAEKRNQDLVVLDRATIMKEALEAQVASDEAKANQLLTLLQPDETGKRPLETGKRPLPAKPQPTGNDSTNRNTKIQENGMAFHKAGVNSFLEMGLPSFFDKNMKELKGPLPITIFNKTWQDAAIIYHAEKRPRLEDSSDKDKYVGLRYPSEWEQTFGEWTINHRGFHAALKDVYKFPTFAGWLLGHKANADRIHAKDGYMAALRYDIHLRTNAFAHKVTVNGIEGVPDISVFRSDIAESAYADARRFEELGFKDNPYAVGGPREGIDPVTGLPKPKSKESSQTGFSQQIPTPSIPFAQGGYLNPTRMQPQFPPQYTYGGYPNPYQNQSRFNHQNQWIPGQATRPPRPRGRNGYRGNNFDPSYQSQRRNGGTNNGPGNGQMVLRDQNQNTG
ncbi:hypothetical protein PGTUg99_036480 [Puccinia graminis f. sp. tritici]|uniref:Uncharacterized protein n=1 Tax=Puccinia graminis f. sp. tritici TaxID=56615 RepID=A0A5B0RPX0_PUCGR|nr:hypothetical protein PGTUg99_036480 [Puccinia graminis f. sp. tritici]